MSILHCQPRQLRLPLEWLFFEYSDATKWTNLRPTLEFTVAYTTGPTTRIWNKMFVEHTIQDELYQVAFWIIPSVSQPRAYSMSRSSFWRLEARRAFNTRSSVLSRHYLGPFLKKNLRSFIHFVA